MSFQENLPNLDRLLDGLRSKCVDHLKNDGFVDANIQTENYLHMRYLGTDCALVSLVFIIWINFYCKL
jgi:N-methylhydantoinase A/oxoprolinase/acetone carboxylase beta subunit